MRAIHPNYQEYGIEMHVVTVICMEIERQQEPPPALFMVISAAEFVACHPKKILDLGMGGWLSQSNFILKYSFTTLIVME